MSIIVVQSQYMPNLWSDVRIDPAASDEVVRQLLATSVAVGEVAAVLAGDGPVIADDWGGPHRLRFDERRERLVAVAGRIADGLLGAATAVTAALAAGEGEQQLRHRLRAELTPDVAPEPQCPTGRAC